VDRDAAHLFDFWPFTMRIFLLALLLCCAPLQASSLTVHECRGAMGEREFSDRKPCASALRTLQLSAPPPAPAASQTASAATPIQVRRYRSTTGRRVDIRVSYFCEEGKRSWYQHTPCSNRAATSESGAGKQAKVKVRQSRVARTQACREIARPSALLRRGNERDENAGPYARAMNRDPCA